MEISTIETPLSLAERDRNFPFNFFANVMDGGFFGFGMGFASFVTLIPLFVSSFTDSAVLIGLIPAIHTATMQLPGLFIAGYVAKQKRYKPFFMQATVHERLPYLFLGLVALFSLKINTQLTLVLTFLMLLWQGFGGGFSILPWQSMIGKIMPAERRGIFYGTQAAALSFLASIGALGSGFILERYVAPNNFAICFLLAFVLMVISYVFLIFVREGEWNIPVKHIDRPDSTVHYRTLLRRDQNFRWFLVVRILFQFANMGVGFYTVYAVKEHGISGSMAGYLTALMTFVLMIGSPLAGWYGDRKGHRLVLGIGAMAASMSALCAWLAPTASWFYLVYALAGLANVGLWTPVLSMTLQFGREIERPVYIGLANTLVAPFAIFAPLLGGWLADMAGYQTTFFVSVMGGLLTACVVFFILRDPRIIESRDRGAANP